MKKIWKKTLAALLMVVTFITQMPVELMGKYVSAEEGNSIKIAEENSVINNVWDGVFMQKPESYGYEYQIQTAEELAWFANEVNQGNTFEGKSIFITGTIDLNKKEWIIIGNAAPDNPCEIKGSIIIKDAVIYGLFCKEDRLSKGLFGAVRVWDMQVDNLTLEDVDINVKSQNYDGFLFGSLEIAKGGNCNIKNSNMSGVLSGKSKCGSIAGYVSGVNDNATLNIENCNIKIDASSYGTMWNGGRRNSYLKGGVIGRYYAQANNNWLILNGVYCEDNLHSYDEYGYNTCTAGGMIGELEGNANIVVYQCAVTGNIISCADQGYAGGIVGKMISCNRYRQSDTCVTADITSKWNVYGYEYNAGGFVEGPLVSKPEGYIKNSYFAGESGTTAAFIAKDKLGQDTSLKLYNCYYDSTLCHKQVYHTDWSCYEVANTVFDCEAYTTENMGIQSNYKGWDFENIWVMGEKYPELRRENFELPDELLEGSGVVAVDSEIVRIVREYASEDFYAQWEEIWLSDYSDDVKAEKILALASSYGITDPKEGLEFVSKSNNKRRAYRILTTDELYMASNFLNWLDEDGNFERVLLGIDGLFFNRELNEWLSSSTYIEDDYPGIGKYKDMLYAYMDSTSSTIEAWNDVKLVSKLAKNVTKGEEMWVEEKITQINALNKLGDREKRKKIIAEMVEKGVFLDVELEKGKEPLDVKLNYTLDKTSGFGQFAKAMGIAKKTIDIVDMTITDIRDILELDSKLQTYYQFNQFLDDIENAEKGEIPFELRVAARQVKEEIDGGYWTEVKKIAGQIMGNCKITSEIRKAIIEYLGVESFNAWLDAVNLEAWFINQVVDIGTMVKKEAYVEGYAFLARLYKKRLEDSRQQFLNSMNEENAWEFYYNYNMLYSLRQHGEEAYLSMCNLKGVCGQLLSFGYAAKEEAVNEVLSVLEESCKFDLGENVSIPESMEYLSKLVVSCPVDVSVYTQAGDCIAELRDGELKDISNEYGRFAVVYNYYTGDYEKVVCILDKSVTISVIPNNTGLVSMEYAYVDENNITRVISRSNMPMAEGDIISITPDILQERGIATITNENESKEIELQETATSYVKMEGAVLSENEVTLTVGEKRLLTVDVEPETASIQDIVWYSSDSEIASVKNGCVKALQEGTAVIYGILEDWSEPLICNLTVSEIQQVDMPTVDIESGVYTSNQSITLTSLTEDVDIYYTMTTDGTEPELQYETENRYTESIEIEGIPGSSVTIKIKAIAKKDGMLDSEVLSLEYVISLPEELLAAPIIITHPSNATVIVGDAVTFSVIAEGTEPLTYQWYVDENTGTFVAITGANSSNYTINEISIDENGYQYYCMVTNSVGSTVSDTAILSVSDVAVDIYTIMISTDGNGLAMANVSRAEAGTLITITAIANEGYVFKEWEIVSEEENPERIPLAHTTFIMPAANVNVKAVFEEKELIQPVEYCIVSGGEGIWIIGSDGAMTISGNGAFAKLVAIEIDGEIINKDYYEATSGLVFDETSESTDITLKKIYMDTLAEGIHSFEIIWNDGSADMTFTVKREENKVSEEPEEPEVPEEKEVVIPEEPEVPEEKEVVIPEEPEVPEEKEVVIPEEPKIPEEKEVAVSEELEVPEEKEIVISEEPEVPEEKEVAIPEEAKEDVVPKETEDSEKQSNKGDLVPLGFILVIIVISVIVIIGVASRKK